MSIGKLGRFLHLAERLLGVVDESHTAAAITGVVDPEWASWEATLPLGSRPQRPSYSPGALGRASTTALSKVGAIHVPAD